MMQRRQTWWLGSVLLVLALTCPPLAGQTPVAAKSGVPAAQAPPAATAPLAQPLPIDPKVVTGTYPNGLAYIIQTNKVPAARVELRLVVKAGSVLEDNDQQGLAHFVEHMAFNGTAHFPKQQLIDFLQSTGMKFGPSINAGTGADETIYQLQIPTDTPGLLEKAFLILEDWAHNVSFDPVEIDKERGVIIEEWRTYRGASARLREKQLPVALKGSRYAERDPIGKPEIIRTFKPETLKRFYTDWYRPDLMTVIAVGDFDQAAVQAMIAQHFSGLRGPKSPRPRAAYDVPDTPGTLFSIETDQELTGTSVAVMNKVPARDHSTVGGYRQDIVTNLFTTMFNQRLAELAQKPDAPLVGGGAGIGPFFVRTKDAATLGATVKETGVERGLDALVGEAQRVARFGFTATEFDRQKRTLLRLVEQQVAEKDKRQSASIVAEYLRHVLQGEPIPGIEYEQALHQRFLPEITLAEVNKLAALWLGESNRIVIAAGPQKEGLVLPDAAALAGVLKTATTRELTAYVDKTDSNPLLDPLPKAGSVLKETKNEAFGMTVWELSNGAKVALKPTDFKQDEIVFSAISPGGASLASDKDYVSAVMAGQVLNLGGAGRFSMQDLRKALADKVASVNVGFSDIATQVSGTGSRKDLETLFQLVHLRFTQPRKDPMMFGVLTTQLKTILANQRNAPEYPFTEALNQILTQGHFRGRSISPALVDELNLDASVAFYKDRLADAAGFTFVFVGSFDLATMKPLVERYLGSLPSAGRHETWKDTGMRLPKGVIEKTVEKGAEQKSHVALVFSGPFAYDQSSRVAVRSLTSVLENRLRETLREDLSGTYGVSVTNNYARVPASEYTISVTFTCAPARVDELVKAMFREIDGLKTAGPSDKHVTDARELMLRDFETNTKLNPWLVGQMAARYADGDDPAAIAKLPDYYRKIDAAFIRQAAGTYLDTKNYVKVVLMPEKK